MKCDSCRRERTDEQLSRHDSSGIRFCKDREECHRYRKEGRYHEAVTGIIDQIIKGGLVHVECAHDKEHGCIAVWSAGAAEQLAAYLIERLSQ